MELEIENTEVVSSNEIQVQVPNSIEVIEGEKDYEVSVVKKEYTIIGDSIFIPSMYEDAPPWLKEFIDTTINVAVTNRDQSLIDRMEAILTLMDYVPKNMYTEQINQIVSEDGIINSRIATLNSNLTDAISSTNATVAEINLTYASKNEASAIATNVITASLSGNGEIGSALIQLQEAYADLESTTAQSINMLESVMEGEINGNATAMETIRTYVGIDSSGGAIGTGLLADVKILQKQNDGIIETVTGTYDVMVNPENPDLAKLILTAEPYATWKAADVSGIDTRLAHIGDVYIKYSITGNGAREYIASYKFIRTVVDTTSPFSTDNHGFTWALIVDQAAQDAYEQALNAYDLADNKRRVFVSNPTVPYDIGDLWLVQAGSSIIGTTQGGRIIQSGDMLRCSETKKANGLYEHNDWIPADNYREGMNAIQADLNSWRTGTYAPFVTSIQSQVDGKSETFYQNSIPTGRIKSLNVASNSTLDKYVGDLWKNIYVGTVGGYLGNNTEYVYTKTANGSKWNYDWTKMEVPDIVFDTIDTKKSIYSGNSVPVAVAPDVVEINDMWITGSAVVAGYDKESIYVWNGTSWIKPLKYTDDTATVALQTGLENGTVNINLNSATINGTKTLTSYIAEEIDKKVVVYSGSNHNTQTGMKINDIYIEKTTAVSTSGITIDVVNTWKYNGTVWIQIGNNSNLTALADLTDGKRTIYSGGSLPVNSTLNPLRPNDLFIPTSTFTASSVTYTANEMYRYNGTLWEKATRYDEIKSLLSAQIDNKIETTYGGAIPPYANQTNVVKDPRGGDYWYCDTNGSYSKGNVYKYTETANGSNYNYTWTLSSDISKGAFDLADKKRIIFGNAGNSIPTLAQGLALADIWIPSSNGTVYFAGKIYKCTNLSPIAFIEVDYTNDEVVNGIIDGSTPLDPNIITIGDTSTTFLEYVQSEIDKKVAIYSGESAPVAGQPSGVAANDIYLWFTTASKVLANGTTQVYDITRTYKYSGSVWNEITTDSNITALADLADGKRTVFSGNTVPVGAVNRDVWIPSATNGVYLKGEIYQYNGTSWIVATKYSADLEAVRNNLQSQVDGKVDTYYQGTVPSGMTALNNGDYWYCTTDVSTYRKGKMYKYVHATTSWVETADVSRYAFDTADGKAAIFTSINAPATGYKVNDMLIVIGSFNNGITTFSDGVVLSSNANRVSGFTASDWVKKINDTEDLDAFVNVTYTPTVTSLQNQIDGKVESWYSLSTNDPKSAWTDASTRAKHDGDMWYQTDTKKSYWYSSSTHSWNLIDDEKAIQALANAATAQATADGVVVSFYAIKQDTAPTTTSMWLNKTGTKVLKEYKTGWINVAVQTGDTLMAYDPVTKDMSTYVYNGSGWITNTENGIVAGSEAITTLTANLSTTNTTVSGHTTQLNTVDTRIANGVASVETKWAYNSVVNINGIYKKSGFGLTTNYTSGDGTQANPYVSEFWIDASRLKFTNSNQTGRVSPFTIDATGTTPQITFNGKVTFSNVTDVPSLGTSSNNLLTNSAPTLGNETYGWQVGWYNTNIVPNAVAAGFDIWRPTGAGSVYVVVGGAPTVGTVFDIKQSNNIPVVAGKRYEISALLSSHRCTSVCTLAFFNSAGTYITEIGAGTANSTAYSGDLSNWVRKGGFVTVPAGTSYAQFYIRSAVTGTDPYCFVAQAYMGEVPDDKTEFSSWSEGVSANSTTIDGGKITTGSIAAGKISSYYLTAANATFADSIITNAAIANGAITNAKIGDAQITNAKIGDLSVSTLKIQDEAVVVPRSASGAYSCSIWYSPTISHAVSILGEWVQGTNRDRIHTYISINGSIVRAENPIYGTLCSMFYNTYFYAGGTYTITLHTDRNVGDMSCRMLLLGTKR